MVPLNWTSRAASSAAKFAGGRAMDSYLAGRPGDESPEDSLAAEAVARVVPPLLRLTGRTAGALLFLAAAPTVAFVAFAVALGVTSEPWYAWIPAVIAAVLAAAVIVLALRRRRLLNSVSELQRLTVMVPNADEGEDPVEVLTDPEIVPAADGIGPETVIVVEEEAEPAPADGDASTTAGDGSGSGSEPAGDEPGGGSRAPGGARRRVTTEASTLSNATLRAVRSPKLFMPRIAALQQILLHTAGGPARAPYLRDDLRVTVLAFIGTVVAIPLGALGALVCFILLIVT